MLHTHHYYQETGTIVPTHQYRYLQDSYAMDGPAQPPCRPLERCQASPMLTKPRMQAFFNTPIEL